MGAKWPHEDDEIDRKKTTPVKRQKITKAKNAVNRCAMLEDILRMTYQTMRVSLEETESEISDAEQLLKHLSRRLEQREQRIQNIISETNSLYKQQPEIEPDAGEITNEMEEVEVKE